MLTKVSLASFAPHTSVLTVLDFSSATLASKPFYQFGIAVRLTKNTGLVSFRIFTTGIAILSTICHFAFTLIVLFFCIPVSHFTTRIWRI